jgi:hypothetical protein
MQKIVVISTPIDRETLQVLSTYFTDAQIIVSAQSKRKRFFAYSKTQNDCSPLLNAIFATVCLLAANQGKYVHAQFS